MTFRILIAAVTAVLLLAGPAAAQNDRETLETIYEKLDGPRWTWSGNWNTDWPLSEWDGVHGGDERVLELDFGGVINSAGDIPRELGNLSHLQIG